VTELETWSELYGNCASRGVDGPSGTQTERQNDSCEPHRLPFACSLTPAARAEKFGVAYTVPELSAEYTSPSCSTCLCEREPVGVPAAALL